MMRFIGITICVFIIGLTSSFSFFKSRSRDYEDIANEIRAEVGKKLSKKHHMNVIGVGGGMMGSVYMIGLSFQIRHPLEMDEARYLVVDCAEELINAVNASEEIRPYLRDYPFTNKNVKIFIFSQTSKGGDVYDPFIRASWTSELDKIYYCTSEPNKLTYKNEYSEPYAEAKAIVFGEFRE